MQNIKTMNIKSQRKLIHVYEVANSDSSNLSQFSVKLYENEEGFREFEIVIANGSTMSYDDVMKHSIYNNFVLPWVYKEKELGALLGDNVVQFRR